MTRHVDGKTLATLDQLTLTLYQEKHRTSPAHGSKVTVSDCTTIRKGMLRLYGDNYWDRKHVNEIMHHELGCLAALDQERQTTPQGWDVADTSTEEQVHDELFDIREVA